MTGLVPVAPIAPTAAAVAQLADDDERWLRWLGQYPATTQREYRRDFRQWVAWCGAHQVDPQEPLPGDVNQWIAAMRQLGLAASTVNRKLSAVASYFAWAEEEGLLQPRRRMPRRRPKVLRDDMRNLGLTAAQTRQLLDAAGGRLGRNRARTLALVSLLVGCGLRVSEAVALQAGDLTLIQGHWTVHVLGKGNKPRTVPVPAFALAAIVAYLAGRTVGPLFATNSGRPLDRREAGRLLARLGRQVGIPGLHPHTLRHTAATAALDAGAPPDLVQWWLGHASIDTTMGYARARKLLDRSPSYAVAKWLADT